MTQMPMIHIRSPRLLNLAVYLTSTVMAGISLALVPDRATQAAAIALCVAFSVVHRLGFWAATNQRQMLAYFAVQTAIITVLVGVTHTSDPFTFPFFLLTIQAVTVFASRPGIAWVVLFFAISSISALWNRGAVGVINILLNTAAFFFAGVFAYLLRQAEQTRREKEQLLQELRATQRQLQDLAVVEERNRLARDLHDSAKQQAFALSAQLDAAHSLIWRDLPAAERHLGQAEQLADNLRHELAGMIWNCARTRSIARACPPRCASMSRSGRNKARSRPPSTCKTSARCRARSRIRCSGSPRRRWRMSRATAGRAAPACGLSMPRTA